jgi:hypothetical protein
MPVMKTTPSLAEDVHFGPPNPFTNEPGIYNLELMQFEPIDAQGAFFQSFGWGNVYPYFVVGKQREQLFCAERIFGSTLQFNFSLKSKQEALAPFATNGKILG